MERLESYRESRKSEVRLLRAHCINNNIHHGPVSSKRVRDDVVFVPINDEKREKEQRDFCNCQTANGCLQIDTHQSHKHTYDSLK